VTLGDGGKVAYDRRCWRPAQAARPPGADSTSTLVWPPRAIVAGTKEARAPW
jgi:hypothetical protein